MPSERRGTVLEDVGGFIRRLQGSAEWKGDKAGTIRLPIARVCISDRCVALVLISCQMDFPVEDVLKNAFDRRQEDIHNASQRCTEVVDDLRGFEKQIGDSYDAITALGDALKGRITSDAGIVDDFVTRLKEYRAGMKDGLGNYEHGTALDKLLKHMRTDILIDKFVAYR